MRRPWRSWGTERIDGTERIITMSIFSLGFFGLLGAGIASMTDAFDRGDVDEATRQGVLAGTVVVERGLATPSRLTQLAAIATVPHVEARAELLPALAAIAEDPDRRTAIPAARAARTIARELAREELPDDLDASDLAPWRARFDALARQHTAFIEVRVLALDTVASLAAAVDPTTLGFDLGAALADPDPALRAAAVALVPRPTPAAMQPTLAKAVLDDADTRVALGAAQALCGDDPKPAIALLGARGLARISTLIAKRPPKTVRDAARCLTK
jgi:hypothetical protein